MTINRSSPRIWASAVAALVVAALLATAPAAVAASPQAAQQAQAAVDVVKADGTLRTVLGKAISMPAPHLARIAAEVCTSYGPGVDVIEVATGTVLYNQRLWIQYCYDGQTVTRLTAPSFTDVLIYDQRVALQVLPVISNALTPTAILDSLGGVNVFFTPTPGAPVVRAQVVIRAVVSGNGGQAAVAGIR